MNLMLDPAMVEHAQAMAEEYLAENKPKPALAYDGPRAWRVVQTIVHGEEDCVEILKDRGHDHYMPKMHKRMFRRRSRKIVTRELILINRYVFACLPSDSRDWGDLTVAEPVVRILGGMSMKDMAMLANIRERHQDGLFDDTDEATRSRREETEETFPPGSAFRAKAGPFGGFSGLVTNVNGRGAVEALINILGRLTKVEFEAAHLERT